jgi:hypothetical protein
MGATAVSEHVAAEKRRMPKNICPPLMSSCTHLPGEKDAGENKRSGVQGARHGRPAHQRRDGAHNRPHPLRDVKKKSGDVELLRVR